MLFRLTWRTRHSLERRLSFDDEYTSSNQDNQTTSKENVNEATTAEADSKSCWHRVLHAVLGLEKKPQHTSQASHLAERMKQFTSIKEKPFWATFVNSHAVIVLLITSFVWGYFA